MRKSLLLTAAFAGLLFTSCHKSSSNGYNPGTGQPAMSYELKATNPSYSAARTSSITGTIVWDSAFATPDVIIFQATQGNVQVQYKATNNQPIDLLSSVALDFGSFTLPVGTYTNVSLKVDLDKVGKNPVLQLNGRVSDSVLTLPVEVLVNESFVLQTDEDSVTIADGSSFVAITTIDLSTVTAGITADMLLNARLTDGVVVISSSSNSNLYRMILENLGKKRQHCHFEHSHH